MSFSRAPSRIAKHKIDERRLHNCQDKLEVVADAPQPKYVSQLRWALFLGGHKNQIEFNRTHRHANADGLSRLPLNDHGSDLMDNTSLDVFALTHFESSPFTTQIIQRETRKDPTLFQVYTATQTSWSIDQKSRFP